MKWAAWRMGDLAGFFVQVLDIQPQEVAGGSEGESGSGGVIPEDGDAQARVKNLGGDVSFPQIPETVCAGRIQSKKGRPRAAGQKLLEGL